MKLISIDTKEATVVTLEGKLEGTLAMQLETFFSDCKKPINKTIHIDLKQVELIKPEGVRVLLNAHINTQDVTLKLLNVNTEVSRLLETVGLAGLALH